MGNCSSEREPMESIVYNWPESHSGRTTYHEPEEQDPVIESLMHDITLHEGEGQTFHVSYKASKGPVQVTLKHTTERETTSIKKSGLIRQGIFEFRIQKAEATHSGTYIVEVLDEGLRGNCFVNPVMASCEVTVE